MLLHTNWEISRRHQKFPSTLQPTFFQCLFASSRFSYSFACLFLGGKPARRALFKTKEKRDVCKSQKNRWKGELNEPHILSLRKEIMFPLFHFPSTHTSSLLPQHFFHCSHFTERKERYRKWWRRKVFRLYFHSFSLYFPFSARGLLLQKLNLTKAQIFMAYWQMELLAYLNLVEN